jgi:hypothetical protein
MKMSLARRLMQAHAPESLTLDKETLITFRLEDIASAEEDYPLVVASSPNGISRDLHFQAIFDAQTSLDDEE